MDLQFVEQTIEQYGRSPDAVIPILQAIQSHYRYLPPEALEHLCDRTDIQPAAVAGVSTFYTQFRHRPVGKHIISVCRGTACHVKGAGQVQGAFERQLGLTDGEDTDSDGLFTVAEVACLGCCTLAPVVQIDDVTYGHLTPSMIPDVLQDFLQKADEPAAAANYHAHASDQPLGEIRIGLGSCCVAQGSGEVRDAVADTIAASNLPVVVKRVGCVGMCHQTPLVEMTPQDGQSQLYAQVNPESVADLVHQHFKPKGFVNRLSHSLTGWVDKLLTDEKGNPIKRHSVDRHDGPVCEFLGPQQHVATEHCGVIDPTDMDEYARGGGFLALRRAIEQMTPDAIIQEMLDSGLRGRGGAGFPSGKKWEAVKNAAGDKKYIVCNGDEGDPGAFMDRMLLESFPYRVIEGMAIAAKAVGATEGYLYIRAEYPLAVKRVRDALEQCHRRGLLGDSILGSKFKLNLKIKEGAGAFVCGEETALLASIEGRRGTPRLRPPFPSEKGLRGLPTLVNNVETFALTPWIIRNGALSFHAMGTEKSRGTKVFALAGKVARGGLIEVPMGVTLREIVEKIGGGVAGGHVLKAVQVGGPSGGCIPAEHADVPVDFEALFRHGAIMGSGGLVVLDETDCMVDIARYFLRFTQDQSCGKCTLCRIGTKRMLDLLDAMCEGRAKKGDIERLEELSKTVRSGSLCGLGKTAPNPVLSTCWMPCARGVQSGAISSGLKSFQKQFAAEAFAGWAKRHRTRSSRRCNTSATSTKPILTVAVRLESAKI